jgi:ethanolamine utilization protein EutA (predicted chaperonin)
MFLKLERVDGRIEYVNVDHINYIDNIGLVLTCGKTVPMTERGVTRIIEKLRESSIVVRTVDMKGTK